MRQCARPGRTSRGHGRVHKDLRPTDVEAAVDAGADALGFVFAASPRQVSPEMARTLCRGLTRAVVRVAVFRHPTVSEWIRVRDVFKPDWVQTDAEDFSGLGRLDCEPLPVFRSADRADTSWPARILFEGARSGRGNLADWQGAARIASRTRMVLAGGLSQDNVVDAIEAVRPWGVDVSSGVERSRGVKDPRRIREFIARVRAAEQSGVHTHVH